MMKEGKNKTLKVGSERSELRTTTRQIVRFSPTLREVRAMEHRVHHRDRHVLDHHAEVAPWHEFSCQRVQRGDQR